MGLIVDEYFAKYFYVFSTEYPTETEKEASEQSIEYQLQTKNKELLTIHNLSEDKLREAIKQGGMPMPSLAIINTKQTQHDEFGEISLIASPSICLLYTSPSPR